MKLFKNISDMRLYLDAQKDIGKTVGFVPTMGALHQGHESLILESKKNTDITVCSIFVNPTQFNVQEDFLKYPVTIDKDVRILTNADCDVLFLPSVDEMYPDDANREMPKKIDFGFLNSTLEGDMRPGHFDGVAQIVEKLLIAVRPDQLFMGQKDFQQVLVVKHLIAERSMNVEVIMCPIIREKDGLAMSSRNTRLTEENRKIALNLSKVIFGIRDELKTKPVSTLLEEGKKQLQGFPSIRLEYLEIVNAENLQVIDHYQLAKDSVLICIAAFVGDVRLIDNVYISK